MKLHSLRLFVLLSGLFFISFVSEERDKNYVYWDSRPVTWDDFKGKAPSNSPFVAMTWSAIRFNFSGEGNNVNVSVETVFDPKQSWKTKNIDDHILNHEQRHFDLTEVYSRILRKEVQETKFKKYESIGPDLQKLFQKNFAACDKAQDKYDDETDHSKKKDQQLLWDAKIDNMLDSLSNWAANDFVLDVGYLLE